MILRSSIRDFAKRSKAASSYSEIWSFVARTYGPSMINGSRPIKLRRSRCFSTTSRRRDESENLNGESRLLDFYKTSLNLPTATHEIKNLDNLDLEGKEVTLHGFLGPRSDLSRNLFFVPLISRDLSHSIQIISTEYSGDSKESSPAHSELKQHGPNTPIVISGRLKSRKPGAVTKDNPNKPKQVKALEVQLQHVYILNHMPKDILVTPGTVYPPEQRHLQIRQSKQIRDALAFRSKAARLCRETLEETFGFVEIETPLLFKSTPEGAREFIVPTRRKGIAYALPQSPQQFKQVLMGSGIQRYYQIARCFRDEDLRADRQPEFTQLDLEMSFAGGEEVMHVIESLTRTLWSKLLDHDLPKNFPRMKYEEAMARYGVDKPDTRYDMQIRRVDHLLPVDLVSKISPLALPAVDAMVMSTRDGTPSKARKVIAAVLESAEGEVFQKNPDGGPGIFIYDSRKPMSGLQPLGFEAAEQFEEMFSLETGDIVVLQARKDMPFSGGSTVIGNLRVALHEEAVRQELVDAPAGFAPLWVTDFPLFSPVSESEPGQGGAAGLASTHHPFTSPKSAEDVDLLLTSPSEVIGEHYDLVMNGVELGGGSRRIHNADMQRLIMESVLQMTPARVAEFSHLLEVLRAGCPPHAGIALGFDRLIATMLGRASVRDVIAFPKSGSGEDMLMKSPGELNEAQLETYHLQLRQEPVYDNVP